MVFSSMNEFASYRIPALYAKGTAIARGPTLQVAVRKCIAENSFHVQKTNLERDQTLFVFYILFRKSIWAMLIRAKCKFLFELP